MASTIPYRATGSLATPLHKAFVREMLLAQDPRIGDPAGRGVRWLAEDR